MTSSTESSTRPTPTPGPWESFGGTTGSWAVIGSEPVANRASAVICRTSGDTPTDAANARLIAATPELRAAVVGLLNGTEHHVAACREPEPCGLCMWIALANDVIDKLDGDA